jgi:hypothetical protein
MSDITPTRRRPHVARRARNLVAGLSAAAFLGFGATMAYAASATQATTRTNNTHPPTAATQPPATVDPFAPLDNGWGGQAAAPSQPFGSGSGGANTSTHGS